MHMIGKVKLPKVIETLGRLEAYHKLIETYRRGHVLGAPDVYVTMRELLNLLFGKSHGRDMKKINLWAKPSKLLDEKQQEEVILSPYRCTGDMLNLSLLGTIVGPIVCII
jgi:hypothetical protein